MRFTLLIANAPDAWARPADATDTDGVIDDWNLYTKALHEAGVLVTGAGLAGNGTATSVTLRGGKRLLTDGPFADTKEHLVGFYLIDVPDLDAALAWAARVPNVRTGTVEVRPVSPTALAHETVGLRLTASGTPTA